MGLEAQEKCLSLGFRICAQGFSYSEEMQVWSYCFLSRFCIDCLLFKPKNMGVETRDYIRVSSHICRCSSNRVLFPQISTGVKSPYGGTLSLPPQILN